MFILILLTAFLWLFCWISFIRSLLMMLIWTQSFICFPSIFGEQSAREAVKECWQIFFHRLRPSSTISPAIYIPIRGEVGHWHLYRVSQKQARGEIGIANASQFGSILALAQYWPWLNIHLVSISALSLYCNISQYWAWLRIAIGPILTLAQNWPWPNIEVGYD